MEQPVVLGGAVDVVVVNHAEGEVEAGREEVAALLAEHVADGWHEARQRHGILVAVRHVDGANHHQRAGNHLGGLVPGLLVERFLGRYRHLELHGGVHLI